MALINYLTRIHFADSVLEDALAEELRHLGISRPLIVADSEGESAEALARVSDALGLLGGVSIEACHAGAARESDLARLDAVFASTGRDSCIGLGGRTALGLARRLARRMACRQIGADVDGGRPGPCRAGGPSRCRHVPVIAIPTTTTCVGLVPLDIEAFKTDRCALPGGACARRGFPGERSLLPDVVLCDPTLTLSAGRHATAAAGMDALVHCIEAYLDTTWNPPADGIALDGVQRAYAHLERAVRDGGDLHARREMLTAALDAGLASQKGFGAIHALAHAVEREIAPPSPHASLHGGLHAALLPAVLAFNGPAIADRLGALRHALQAEDVGGAVSALARRISLPLDLSGLELDAEARRRIARRASEDRANQTNPRHATEADYVRMLEHAG